MSVYDDTTVLPTVEQTAEALEHISEGRKAAVAIALRTLAERLIATVCEVDRELGILQCIRSIKVSRCNSGSFQLDIDDLDTGLDTAALSREIEAGLASPAFDKRLRSVQLEQGEFSHGPEEERPEAAAFPEQIGGYELESTEFAGSETLDLSEGSAGLPLA